MSVFGDKRAGELFYPGGFGVEVLDGIHKGEFACQLLLKSMFVLNIQRHIFLVKV